MGEVLGQPMLSVPSDILVLLFAVLIDLVSRELPSKCHPTAWMGKTVSLAEQIAPDTKVAQLLFGTLMGLSIPASWAIGAYFAAWGLASIHEIAYILVGAVLLKTTFALRMLHRVGTQVRDFLMEGDIWQVRENMRSLVSRDVSNLSAEQAVGGAVESVSENITDSVIGPLLAFAIFGLPGAVAYRAVNTLDSMVGYHGHYEYLGKASAKLDDLVNLVPARLTALLLVAASAVLPGQRVSAAWRIMWRDRHNTESPNAGWTMSGMAGALGVQLEKAGHYRLGDPTRPLLPKDIDRAVQTMYAVTGLSLLIAVSIIFLREGIF